MQLCGRHAAGLPSKKSSSRAVNPFNRQINSFLLLSNFVPKRWPIAGQLLGGQAELRVACMH